MGVNRDLVKPHFIVSVGNWSIKRRDDGECYIVFYRGDVSASFDTLSEALADLAECIDW